MRCRVGKLVKRSFISTRWRVGNELLEVGLGNFTDTHPEHHNADQVMDNYTSEMVIGKIKNKDPTLLSISLQSAIVSFPNTIHRRISEYYIHVHGKATPSAEITERN